MSNDSGPGCCVVGHKSDPGSDRIRTPSRRAYVHIMNTSERTDLRQVRRYLARSRGISVVTSAGVGIVLVALAARLDPAAAVATTLFAIAAVVAAVRLATAENRCWRRALIAIRTDGIDAERHDSTDERREHDPVVVHGYGVIADVSPTSLPITESPSPVYTTSHKS